MKSKERDYVFIYLFNNIIILDNFIRESFLESIDGEDLFKIIVQFVKFNLFINTQTLYIFNNISKLLSLSRYSKKSSMWNLIMIFRFISKSLKNSKVFKYDFGKCDNFLCYNVSSNSLKWNKIRFSLYLSFLKTFYLINL